MVVGFAVDHAQGRLDNGVGLLVVEQSEVAVGLGSGLLDQAERLDKATRKALATDGKVVNGTLGLRAVKRLGRDFYIAEGVFLDSIF